MSGKYRLTSGLCLTLLLLPCWCQMPNDDTWIPPRQPRIYRSGEVTTFHTHGKDNMRQAWYQVEDRTSFLFGVRTCEEAIVLISDESNTDVGVYEAIKIGTDGNSKTTLVANDGSVLASEDTPIVLFCDIVQYFWLDWRSSYMALGHGQKIGEDVLLSYWEPGWNLKVIGVGFTSETEEGADWLVRENSGDKLVYFSKGETSYGNFWKSVSSRVWYTFQVKACSDAHILLTSSAKNWQGTVYEIVLGALENTENYIRSKAFSKEPKDILVVHPEAVLSCDDFRDFWVSWMGGTIQVGKGSVHGRYVLMQCASPKCQPLEVRDVGVLTAGEEDAEWRFPDSLQSTTTFKTYVYQKKPEHWLEVPDVSAMKFSVTACDQVSLYLSDSQGDDAAFSYVIDIYFNDAAKGRMSGLRKLPSEEYLASEPTLHELSCLTAREYWIEWKDGLIRFGRGAVYGENDVFEGVNYDKKQKIQTIGFFTPSTEGAVWNIPESSGYQMLFSTMIPGFDVWQTVQARRDVTFGVMTSAGAALALSPTTGVDFFESYISITLENGNGSSVIALVDITGSTVIQRVTIPNIVRPDAFKEYWVSWDDGKIEVGEGPIVGEYVIMGARNELEDRVTAVGFDATEIGTYVVREDPGDVIMTSSNGDEGFDVLMIEEDMTWITFSLQACSDMMLVIGSGDSLLGSVTIMIASGGTENYMSYEADSRTVLVAESISTGELSCEDAREFWVSWEDGHIQIGHGILQNQTLPILQWEYGAPMTITWLRFTTNNAVSGQWLFRQNAAPRGYFTTQADIVRPHTITRTLEHHTNMVFGVQSCSKVTVLLSDQPTVATDRSFEVNIGDNRNSELNVIQGYRNRQSRIATPDILSCNETRHFWMAWDRGSLSIGSGEVIGHDTLMDYAGSRGASVRAATFSSSSDEDTDWDIPMYEAFWKPANSTLPPTRKPTPDSGSGGLSSGEVAGIVIGVLLLVILVAAAVLLVLHRRQIISLPLPSSIKQLVNES